MNYNKWFKLNTCSLRGKTVAISGATGGIGRELCRHYAKLGANILTLDRNSPRSLVLCDELKAEFPELKTSHLNLDLEDASSVIKVTEELIKDPPDYLILNAGAYHIPRKRCSTDYGNVFQINFVSPYYRAKKLMPEICKKGGNIVAVGSIAHRYSKADKLDVDFSTRTKSSLVYGNAKRYLMYSLFALNCENVNIAHPGITFTNITAHYPKLIFAIIKHPMKIIFMKPKKACLSIIKATFEKGKDNFWIGPRIFDVWGKPKASFIKPISSKEAEIILETAKKSFDKMENFKITL